MDRSGRQEAGARRGIKPELMLNSRRQEIARNFLPRRDRRFFDKSVHPRTV
jgi:hypothetical protein